MPDSLYDRDILVWCDEQAEQLRLLAAGDRPNVPVASEHGPITVALSLECPYTLDELRSENPNVGTVVDRLSPARDGA